MNIKYPFEIGCFLILIVLLNFVAITNPSVLALYPSALFDGEFWRWLTFPWRHISLYHLAMDASAFLFLYQSLRCKFAARLQHLAFCIVFSGLIPILLDPRLSELGLCGLSGVAHGLMLLCAFECAEQRQKSVKILAIVLFLGVLGKTIFEQLTGNVLFAAHHLGNVGTPIASCHYGGLLGAFLSYVLRKLSGDREAHQNSSLIPAHLPPHFDHAHLEIDSTFRGSAAHERNLLRCRPGAR